MATTLVGGELRPCCRGRWPSFRVVQRRRRASLGRHAWCL